MSFAEWLRDWRFTNQVNYVPLIQGIFPKKSATYLYYQPRNWHFPSSVEKVFMGQINTIIPLVFINFLYFSIYLENSHCTTIFWVIIYRFISWTQMKQYQRFGATFDCYFSRHVWSTVAIFYTLLLKMICFTCLS